MITNEEVNIETTDNSTVYANSTSRNSIVETNKNIIHGDSLKIQGFVDIKNGNTHIEGKNKFTQSMLKHIMNFLSNAHTSNYYYMTLGCYNYNMYIGTDIVTPTVYNTTVLSLPIGTTPGTPPNTLSGSSTNPSNGVFKITITATWNAGTVSGTVGEMALYLNSNDTTLQAAKWTTTVNLAGTRLASRLSVADGSFSPFLINTAHDLVIVWTIQLSF